MGKTNQDLLDIWVFPKIGGKPIFNGWFIRGSPIKMDDLGVPLFLETPIWIHLTSIDQAKYVIWCCMMYASEIWSADDPLRCTHCFSASWTLVTGSPSLQEKGSQKHSKACSSRRPSRASCKRRFDGKAVLTQMWGEIQRRGFRFHSIKIH